MSKRGGGFQFQSIATVPEAATLVDYVLNKTQRKTPTEVHKQFKISRIRGFYMRKVKFCQSTISEKLKQIMSDFPMLDDIHPFYSDLCNVLYDRDHYKLALSKVRGINAIVEGIAKDYLKLLKYADSLFKCKMLKRAALGRCATTLRRLQGPLTYLEQVRQHMTRLPSINPTTRTLLITGYPNVGKSSFINQVSQANVEVQPFAFTTKSLYVGHFDYSYVRWQIIDTPGILDRPLDQRNTIEMTAVTALAHIHAVILYMLDLSETCGYSVVDQVNLYQSIKPLFLGKPVILILNKTDLQLYENLNNETKQLIESLTFKNPITNLEEQPPKYFTATISGNGVDEAKTAAAEYLLKHRQANQTESTLQPHNSALHTATVYTPNIVRTPSIPQDVQEKLNMRASGMQIPKPASEKVLEENYGGAGVYVTDFRKNHLIRNEWKYDQIPEFFDGENVADYVDPDIDAKLKKLEEEEQILAQSDFVSKEEMQMQDKWLDIKQQLGNLHRKIALEKTVSKLSKPGKGAILPRKTFQEKDLLKKMGTDTLPKHIKARPIADSMKVAVAKKRSQLNTIQARIDQDFEFANVKKLEGPEAPNKRPAAEILKDKKQRALLLRTKRVNATPKHTTIQHPTGLNKVNKLRLSKDNRRSSTALKRQGKKGEADRGIPCKKPKHLFSGKRGNGKTDRR